MPKAPPLRVAEKRLETSRQGRWLKAKGGKSGMDYPKNSKIKGKIHILTPFYAN